MALERVSDQIMEVDLLVIGGGIAGCFAAIKASEAGAKVAIFDKAGIRRSGAAGAGLDHLGGSLPPHVSAEELAMTISMGGKTSHRGKGRVLKGLVNENLTYIGLKECWDRIHDLESWGFQARWDDGNYKWGYDAGSGEPSELHIHGKDIKINLSEKIRKMPITLLERTMAIDLLTDNNGTVVGATGINIRTGQFVVCKAKVTFLGTGRTQRIYNPFSGVHAGKFKMIFHYPGSGDGLAIAFRAGAELINMEITSSGAGAAARCKEYEKDLGVHAGAFHALRAIVVNYRGDRLGEGSISAEIVDQEEMAGRGPLFFDATQMPEEVHQTIEQNARDEAPAMIDLAKDRGLETRKHRFEIIWPYKPDLISRRLSGVYTDEEARTSLKGLYVAGDMIGGSTYSGAMLASVFGARAGKNAAEYTKGIGKVNVSESQVKDHRESVLAPLRQRDGVAPLELEIKMRDIMDRYCGALRSEGRLNQGLWRLYGVKERFLPELRAKDYHELMTSQEVRNIIQLSEVVMLSAKERKESAPTCQRLDYPEKKEDPWGSSIVIKKVGKEIKFSRREMPTLKL